MDPALSSSYARHLLEGNSLPISYHNFFSMQATLDDNNSFSLPIQRGLNRLSAIYVTFWKQGTPFVTHFSSPLPEGGYLDRTKDNFHFQLQLGDLKPTYQTDSVGELFYRLRMCQGIHEGTDSFSIEYTSYTQGPKFIIGMSLEKVLGQEAIHTRVSTLGGQLLYIHIKNCHFNVPATVHVVAHYDCVLTITSGGCELAF
jgi:hypothetical protein